LQRIYTPGEIDYCLRHPLPAQALAARFAAKEAFFKALAADQVQGITHRAIEVELADRGMPRIKPHGAAEAALGKRRVLLSISHDGDLAIAVVFIFSEVTS